MKRETRLRMQAHLTAQGLAMQEYDSLPAGNWTFAVTATDAAGNAEVQPQSAGPWQVDMAAFVQITGGDAGATITRQA